MTKQPVELITQQIQALTEMQENYRDLNTFISYRVTETQIAAEKWKHAETWARSVTWDKNNGNGPMCYFANVVALSAKLAEAVKHFAEFSSDAGDVVTAKLEEICDREQINP